MTSDDESNVIELYRFVHTRDFKRTDPGQLVPKLCRTLVNSYLCIYVCLHICMKAMLNKITRTGLLIKLKFNLSIFCLQ